MRLPGAIDLEELVHRRIDYEEPQIIDSDFYFRVRDRLNLLISVSLDLLSAGVADDLQIYSDAGEFELAIELYCTALYEGGISIGFDRFRLLAELTEQLDVDPSILVGLLGDAGYTY